MFKSILGFLVKYLALWFLLAAVALLFTWALPAKGADGSDWVVGIVAVIGLLIIYKSYRATGKLFTDESGGM